MQFNILSKLRTWNAKPYVDLPTLEITDTRQGSTISFDLVLSNDAIQGGWVFPPKSSNVVAVIISPVVHFRGPISSPTINRVNPAETRFSCQGTDYTRFLDRVLIHTERPEEYAGARIAALVSWATSELGIFRFYVDRVRYVKNGSLLPEETYDYQTLSSIFDDLAERSMYQWYIDFDRYIHFSVQETWPSPLDHNYKNRFNLDTNLEIGGVELTEDASQVRNVIYIKDYAAKSGNKYQDGPYQMAEGQSFQKIQLEPWDIEDTNVWVKEEGEDWVARVVRLDPLLGTQAEMTGREGEAYICTFNMGIRFPLSDLPGAGAYVKAEYYAKIPDQITKVEDIWSIREMAERENSSGAHEWITSEPDLAIEDASVARILGEYLLRRYAWPLWTGSFTDLKVRGWKPGQFFRIRSKSMDLYNCENYRKTGKKIDMIMYVHSVTKTIQMYQEESTGRTREFLIENVEFSNMPYAES